jgi:type I restriction enzyme S subunit
MIMDKFWVHEIPLPAPKEQRRIVELLEQADGLRRQRAEAGQLADRILPALFHKMFGDPATNSKRLRTEKLEAVALVQRGDFRHRPRTEPRFYGGPYPFIQINDITSSGLLIRAYSQTLNEEGRAISRMFPAGTVVISIAATIAASGILAFDSCFPDSLVGVRSHDDRTSQEFLLFYLRLMAPHLGRIAPQLAQKNINLQILNALDVPIPPQESLQVFTRAVKSLLALEEKAAETRRNITTLFATMLHRAFTGELTAKWREAHLKELLAEMEQQARLLRDP